MKGRGPKQLAEQLRLRCMRELGAYTSQDDENLPTTAGSEYFYLGPVFRDPGMGEKSHAPSQLRCDCGPGPTSCQRHDGAFTIWKVYVFKGASRVNEWTTDVLVTEDLDVILHGESGSVERTILECALRGPD